MFGIANRGVRYREREAAYAVILDAHRRVAAVRARHGLFLPGGCIESGESPAEALLRESLEECGRPLEITGPIGEAIQYGHGDESPLRARHRFFEARFRDAPDASAEDPVSWLHIDEACGWFRHESHVWAVRTLLGEREP
jgi:8-oxo-dGTP diphosphatase